MTLTDKSRAELEALIAEAQAALAAKEVEPDYEAWRPALQAFCVEASYASPRHVFDEHEKCLVRGLIAALPLAPAEPVAAPQDHWTVVGAIKSARALIKAADDLCFAAETSGGVAGRDAALCAAIAQWAAERDKQKQVLRIIELEGDEPEIGAGRLDHPLREPTLAHRGARWPGEDVLRGMARECAALGYERIGEKRNAQQARFGEFDDGILPQLALEAMRFAIYYMKHGDVPPTCPQSPEKDA
jgi:hypothetical protein